MSRGHKNEVIVGETHGRLTAVSATDLKATGYGPRICAVWLCECGNEKIFPITRVRANIIRSCGCDARELLRMAATKHGGRGTPTYQSWQAIKRRCLIPEDKDYYRYGAVGITICEEWREDYAAFLAHLGPRPIGKTVDRINPTKGYEPGNVRWATPHEQAMNRRDIVMISTPSGTMPISEYAKSIGITKGAAHLRLKRGKLDGCHRI